MSTQKDAIAEALAEWQIYVTQKLEEGHERMDRLEGEVKANTTLTAGLKDDTSELLDILSTAKGGLKVLGGLGTILKWTAGVVAAVATIWAALTGKLPN